MEGFCSLASGSKGNSLFLGTKKTKILIDAGISAKATEKKLGELGVALEEIQAILITHEHTDHIAGLKTLAFKYKIPVFANAETAKGIFAAFHECPLFKIFTTGEDFSFGDLLIHPFCVQHDTPDPVAFTIHANGIKIGICTDLGFATTLVENHLKHCHYLHVEANHKIEWVHACSRPPIYKQRVLGRSGHLSNDATATLLEKVAHDDLREIHLAHLSQECNSPEEALGTIQLKLQDKIDAAVISVSPQERLGKKVYF